MSNLYKTPTTTTEDTGLKSFIKSIKLGNNYNIRYVDKSPLRSRPKPKPTTIPTIKDTSPTIKDTSPTTQDTYVTTNNQELQEINFNLQEFATDTYLRFANIADKLDLLNQGVNTLIQSHHEYMVELSVRGDNPSSHASGTLSGVILTTCFLSPIAVFLIEYSRRGL